MPTQTTAERIDDHYDLCIVGAGISGLNALYSALHYLPQSARVLLVDSNPTCGGMWTQTYDYVRLHQPHQMFTVGDLEWLWDKPPEYLATGSEVLWHLQSCLDRMRGKVRLTERYETNCLRIEEIETKSGARAVVHLERQDGTRSKITASRAIHAAGWNVPAIEPLNLTSQQIISSCPMCLSEVYTNSASPALIIGGGKTGMDTALALMDGDIQREITLLNGRGAIFGNRDRMFPTGAKRWWRGDMVGSLSADVVGKFNGNNALSTFEHFRSRYAISPDMHGAQYMFSTMSGAESERLSQGLTSIRHGYLEDVIDGPTGPMAVLRDGTSFSIPRDTLVVNCTGHFAASSDERPAVLSQMGTILHINPRASIYFLSTSASYFLTHAFFLNVLRTMPLYVLDMDSLKGRSPQFYFLTCLTHSFHNMMVFMNHLPLSVFSSCGLDINRWFPLHRRLFSFARIKLRKHRYIGHSRAVLDRLHSDGSISCQQDRN
jgi:hypothetical protein